MGAEINFRTHIFFRGFPPAECAYTRRRGHRPIVSPRRDCAAGACGGVFSQFPRFVCICAALVCRMTASVCMIFFCAGVSWAYPKIQIRDKN
ncbi:hypothetical protein HMPREF1631_00130 [Arcanobacterium sp. S3PF19]|nr:hypothetical protein HMPREF1631_00130 [Arcanobacterium sp. S3PF19]